LLQVEEFTEPFDLGAGYGNFGVFAVVHAEQVAGFEPGDDFADVFNVDEVGAVGAPEGGGVDLVGELFDGAAVGEAFQGCGDDGDVAFLDGGEADVVLVDEQETLAVAHDDFAGALFACGARGCGEERRSVCGAAGVLQGGGFGLLLQQFEQALQPLFAAGLRQGFKGCGRAGGEALANFLDGLLDAALLKGLEEVVDRVDFKGADSVLVEGGGEDDLGHGCVVVPVVTLAVEEFFQDREAVQAGHLDVEEDDVGAGGADDFDRLDAVGGFGDDFDFACAAEQVVQFAAGEGFIVDDDGGDGHAFAV